MKQFILATVAAMTLGTMAHAAPITFFGENLSPAETTTGAPVTARNAFLSTLAGNIGTEDFETPTTLPEIQFPGSSGDITATLNGDATIYSTPFGGRFATSGSRFVETASGSGFNITFSTAISAFGFYGTDIGDFGNNLILRLTKEGGGTVDLSVGNNVGANGSSEGSLLFFGFIDVNQAYTRIDFLNTPGGEDVFGFDDMIIGDSSQIVNPPAVPLPAAGWLLLAAVGGLSLMKRRLS